MLNCSFLSTALELKEEEEIAGQVCFFSSNKCRLVSATPLLSRLRVRRCRTLRVLLGASDCVVCRCFSSVSRVSACRNSSDSSDMYSLEGTCTYVHHGSQPRLVVSRSTCPPLSPSPHANSFIIVTAVINTHTAGKTRGGASGAEWIRARWEDDTRTSP